MTQNFADWGFLLLRLVMTGMLATFHGWGKFMGAIEYLFRGQEWGFAAFLGGIGFPIPTFFALCAALAECIGCLLLAVGLFTRYAAALVAITMSVAVFYHLRTDMGFELAALYLVISLFFVFAGAGRFSVDQWLNRRSTPAPGRWRVSTSERQNA